MALIPVRTAWVSACASGEPPPQGMVSSRVLASAMERVGGSSTSARCPWKGINATLSRDWYASVSSPTAAPVVATVRTGSDKTCHVMYV